jgi:mono/diheme cytochrome c family protein
MLALGLASCAPAGGGAGAPAGTAVAMLPAERGAALFEGSCSACHQQNARGIPGVYPSLVGSSVVLGDPRDFVLWVIEGRRAPTMPAGRYTTVMPQFGWMKAADAAALLTYLRTNFGNSAPPADADVVSRALED